MSLTKSFGVRCVFPYESWRSETFRIRGVVAMENLGDVAMGHEGCVMEVDKDGDIKAVREGQFGWCWIMI